MSIKTHRLFAAKIQMRGGSLLDKEKKNRSPTGIYFPCTESQKRTIKSIASKCGLGQGEYILKRALGYEPKTVLPDAFFDFHDKLCRILDSPPTPDVEKAALRVFDEIYAQLIDSKKQTPEEIMEEIGGEGVSQQSGSGP